MWHIFFITIGVILLTTRYGLPRLIPWLLSFALQRQLSTAFNRRTRVEFALSETIDIRWQWPWRWQLPSHQSSSNSYLLNEVPSQSSLAISSKPISIRLVKPKLRVVLPSIQSLRDERFEREETIRRNGRIISYASIVESSSPSSSLPSPPSSPGAINAARLSVGAASASRSSSSLSSSSSSSTELPSFICAPLLWCFIRWILTCIDIHILHTTLSLEDEENCVEIHLDGIHFDGTIVPPSSHHTSTLINDFSTNRPESACDLGLSMGTIALRLHLETISIHTKSSLPPNPKAAPASCFPPLYLLNVSPCTASIELPLIAPTQPTHASLESIAKFMAGHTRIGLQVQGISSHLHTTDLTQLERMAQILIETVKMRDVNAKATGTNLSTSAAQSTSSASAFPSPVTSPPLPSASSSPLTSSSSSPLLKPSNSSDFGDELSSIDLIALQSTLNSVLVFVPTNIQIVVEQIHLSMSNFPRTTSHRHVPAIFKTMFMSPSPSPQPSHPQASLEFELEYAKVDLRKAVMNTFPFAHQSHSTPSVTPTIIFDISGEAGLVMMNERCKGMIDASPLMRIQPSTLHIGVSTETIERMIESAPSSMNSSSSSTSSSSSSSSSSSLTPSFSFIRCNTLTLHLPEFFVSPSALTCQLLSHAMMYRPTEDILQETWPGYIPVRKFYSSTLPLSSSIDSSSIASPTAPLPPDTYIPFDLVWILLQSTAISIDIESVTAQVGGFSFELEQANLKIPAPVVDVRIGSGITTPEEKEAIESLLVDDARLNEITLRLACLSTRIRCTAPKGYAATFLSNAVELSQDCPSAPSIYSSTLFSCPSLRISISSRLTSHSISPLLNLSSRTRGSPRRASPRRSSPRAPIPSPTHSRRTVLSPNTAYHVVKCLSTPEEATWSINVKVDSGVVEVQYVDWISYVIEDIDESLVQPFASLSSITPIDELDQPSTQSKPLAVEVEHGLKWMVGIEATLDLNIPTIVIALITPHRKVQEGEKDATSSATDLLSSSSSSSSTPPASPSSPSFHLVSVTLQRLAASPTISHTRIAAPRVTLASSFDSIHIRSKHAESFYAIRGIVDGLAEPSPSPAPVSAPMSRPTSPSPSPPVVPSLVEVGSFTLSHTLRTPHSRSVSNPPPASVLAPASTLSPPAPIGMLTRIRISHATVCWDTVQHLSIVCIQASIERVDRVVTILKHKYSKLTPNDDSPSRCVSPVFGDLSAADDDIGPEVFPPLRISSPGLSYPIRPLHAHVHMPHTSDGRTLSGVRLHRAERDVTDMIIEEDDDIDGGERMSISKPSTTAGGGGIGSKIGDLLAPSSSDSDSETETQQIAGVTFTVTSEDGKPTSVDGVHGSSTRHLLTKKHHVNEIVQGMEDSASISKSSLAHSPTSHQQNRNGADTSSFPIGAHLDMNFDADDDDDCSLSDSDSDDSTDHQLSADIIDATCGPVAVEVSFIEFIEKKVTGQSVALAQAHVCTLFTEYVRYNTDPSVISSVASSEISISECPYTLFGSVGSSSVRFGRREIFRVGSMRFGGALHGITGEPDVALFMKQGFFVLPYDVEFGRQIEKMQIGWKALKHLKSMLFDMLPSKPAVYDTISAAPSTSASTYASPSASSAFSSPRYPFPKAADFDLSSLWLSAPGFVFTMDDSIITIHERRERFRALSKKQRREEIELRRKFEQEEETMTSMPDNLKSPRDAIDIADALTPRHSVYAVSPRAAVKSPTPLPQKSNHLATPSYTTANGAVKIEDATREDENDTTMPNVQSPADMRNRRSASKEAFRTPLRTTAFMRSSPTHHHQTTYSVPSTLQHPSHRGHTSTFSALSPSPSHRRSRAALSRPFSPAAGGGGGHSRAGSKMTSPKNASFLFDVREGDDARSGRQVSTHASPSSTFSLLLERSGAGDASWWLSSITHTSNRFDTACSPGSDAANDCLLHVSLDLSVALRAREDLLDPYALRAKAKELDNTERVPYEWKRPDRRQSTANQSGSATPLTTNDAPPSTPGPPLPPHPVGWFTELWARDLVLHGVRMLVRLRDYPVPLLSTPELLLSGLILIGTMNCPEPFIKQNHMQLNGGISQVDDNGNEIDTRDTITIILPGTSCVPLKLYHELTLELATSHLTYGPCLLRALDVVSQAASRMSSPDDPLDLTPKLAWWHKLRYLLHGTFHIHLYEFELRLLTNLQPYIPSFVYLSGHHGVIQTHQGLIDLQVEDLSVSCIIHENEWNPMACGLHFLPGMANPLLWRQYAQGRVIYVPRFHVKIGLKWVRDSHAPKVKQLRKQSSNTHRKDPAALIPNRVNPAVNHYVHHEYMVTHTHAPLARLVNPTTPSTSSSLTPLPIHTAFDLFIAHELDFVVDVSMNPPDYACPFCPAPTTPGTDEKADATSPPSPVHVDGGHSSMVCVPYFTLRWWSLCWLQDVVTFFVTPPAWILPPEELDHKSFGDVIHTMQLSLVVHSLRCELLKQEVAHSGGMSMRNGMKNINGILICLGHLAIDMNFVAAFIQSHNGTIRELKWQEPAVDVLQASAHILVPKGQGLGRSKSNGAVGDDNDDLPVDVSPQSSDELRKLSEQALGTRRMRRRGGSDDLRSTGYNVADECVNFVDRRGNFISPFDVDLDNKVPVFLCSLRLLAFRGHYSDAGGVGSGGSTASCANPWHEPSAAELSSLASTANNLTKDLPFPMPIRLPPSRTCWEEWFTDLVEIFDEEEEAEATAASALAAAGARATANQKHTLSKAFEKLGIVAEDLKLEDFEAMKPRKSTVVQHQHHLTSPFLSSSNGGGGGTSEITSPTPIGATSPSPMSLASAVHYSKLSTPKRRGVSMHTMPASTSPPVLNNSLRRHSEMRYGTNLNMKHVDHLVSVRSAAEVKALLEGNSTFNSSAPSGTTTGPTRSPSFSRRPSVNAAAAGHLQTPHKRSSSKSSTPAAVPSAHHHSSSSPPPDNPPFLLNVNSTSSNYGEMFKLNVIPPSPPAGLSPSVVLATPVAKLPPLRKVPSLARQPTATPNSSTTPSTPPQLPSVLFGVTRGRAAPAGVVLDYNLCSFRNIVVNLKVLWSPAIKNAVRGAMANAEATHPSAAYRHELAMHGAPTEESAGFINDDGIARMNISETIGEETLTEGTGSNTKSSSRALTVTLDGGESTALSTAASPMPARRPQLYHTPNGSFSVATPTGTPGQSYMTPSQHSPMFTPRFGSGGGIGSAVNTSHGSYMSNASSGIGKGIAPTPRVSHDMAELLREVDLHGTIEADDRVDEDTDQGANNGDGVNSSSSGSNHASGLRRALTRRERLTDWLTLFELDCIRPQINFTNPANSSRVILSAARARLESHGLPTLFDVEQQIFQQQPAGSAFASNVNGMSLEAYFLNTSNASGAGLSSPAVIGRPSFGRPPSGLEYSPAVAPAAGLSSKVRLSHATSSPAVGMPPSPIPASQRMSGGGYTSLGPPMMHQSAGLSPRSRQPGSAQSTGSSSFGTPLIRGRTGSIDGSVVIPHMNLDAIVSPLYFEKKVFTSLQNAQCFVVPSEYEIEGTLTWAGDTLISDGVQAPKQHHAPTTLPSSSSWTTGVTSSPTPMIGTSASVPAPFHLPPMPAESHSSSTASSQHKPSHTHFATLPSRTPSRTPPVRTPTVTPPRSRRGSLNQGAGAATSSSSSHHHHGSSQFLLDHIFTGSVSLPTLGTSTQRPLASRTTILRRIMQPTTLHYSKSTQEDIDAELLRRGLGVLDDLNGIVTWLGEVKQYQRQRQRAGTGTRRSENGAGGAAGIGGRNLFNATTSNVPLVPEPFATDSTDEKRVLREGIQLYLPALEAQMDSAEFKTLINVVQSVLLSLGDDSAGSSSSSKSDSNAPPTDIPIPQTATKQDIAALQAIIESVLDADPSATNDGDGTNGTSFIMTPDGRRTKTSNNKSQLRPPIMLRGGGGNNGVTSNIASPAGITSPNGALTHVSQPVVIQSRVQYYLGQVSWAMLRQQRGFIKQSLNGMFGDHVFFSDLSVGINAQIQQISLKSLIIPSSPAEHYHHLVRPEPYLWLNRDTKRDMMVHVRALIREPLGTHNPLLHYVTAYEHFELTFFPLVVCLPHDHALMLRDYFLPELDDEHKRAKLDAEAKASAVASKKEKEKEKEKETSTATSASAPAVNQQKSSSEESRNHSISGSTHLYHPKMAANAKALVSRSSDEKSQTKGETRVVVVADTKSHKSASGVAAIIAPAIKYFKYIRINSINFTFSFRHESHSLLTFENVHLHVSPYTKSKRQYTHGWSELFESIEKHIVYNIISHGSEILAQKMGLGSAPVKNEHDLLSPIDDDQCEKIAVCETDAREHGEFLFGPGQTHSAQRSLGGTSSFDRQKKEISFGKKLLGIFSKGRGSESPETIERRLRKESEKREAARLKEEERDRAAAVRSMKELKQSHSRGGTGNSGSGGSGESSSSSFFSIPHNWLTGRSTSTPAAAATLPPPPITASSSTHHLQLPSASMSDVGSAASSNTTTDLPVSSRSIFAAPHPAVTPRTAAQHAAPKTQFSFASGNA